MVKLEVNSNRLVSGKGISFPAAASLEFLVAVTEIILARGDGSREVRQTRGFLHSCGKVLHISDPELMKNEAGPLTKCPR
jgi:hypothetical protein